SEDAESTSIVVDYEHPVSQERTDLIEAVDPLDIKYSIPDTIVSPVRDENGDEDDFDDDCGASTDNNDSIELNHGGDSFIDGAAQERERTESLMPIGSASDGSVSTGCSAESEEQDTCFEASTNVEDSIDVWVEELLEQRPKDE
ncbi:MAG: hypothetical protein SGARI_005182, partial [Bacillariaceae sp.]